MPDARDSLPTHLIREDRLMGWLPIVATAAELIGQHATDAAQTAMLGMDETHQLMLQAREMAHQELMDDRSERFNEAIQERSERMRERSLLDDLNMTDRKIDDKMTKDWIGLIRGQ
jgi:hypothetical protein